jgi:hypothetical protein
MPRLAAARVRSPPESAVGHRAPLLRRVELIVARIVVLMSAAL